MQIHSALHSVLFRIGLFAFASAPLFASPQSGPERWLVSTTSSFTSSFLMDSDDAAVIQVSAQQAPHTYLTRGNWFALSGFEPSDIDAIGLMPMGLGNDQREAFVFSLLSNEKGLLDGDILRPGANGVIEILVPETTLLALLGVPNGNIDLDAVDYDNQGRLLFSLQANLTGTTLGDVANGDVLRVEPGGFLSRLYSEAEIQTAFNTTGSPAGAIGDVQGLTTIGSDLYVALQGPSSVDGGILRLGSNPKMMMNEAALGLGGAEIDALTSLDVEWKIGAIAIETATSTPGAFVHSEGHGFTPSSLVLLLMAGLPGFDASFPLGGFKDVFIDLNDPWFLANSMTGGPTVVATDLTGAFNLDFQIPPGIWGGNWNAGQGWSFQALDLSDLSLSAPFRVQLF